MEGVDERRGEQRRFWWGESYLGDEEDLLERGAGDVLPGPGKNCSMGLGWQIFDSRDDFTYLQTPNFTPA